MVSRFGRTYTVHVKTDVRHPYETARFIREGFHFWAFVFGPLWALAHRLWLLAFVTFAGLIALIAVAEKMGLSEGSSAVLQLALQAGIAFWADESLRNQARREGYVIADIVMADTKLHAEQRFFDRALATA